MSQIFNKISDKNLEKVMGVTGYVIVLFDLNAWRIVGSFGGNTESNAFTKFWLEDLSLLMFKIFWTAISVLIIFYFLANKQAPKYTIVPAISYIALYILVMLDFINSF